jgi:hypothetical protein
MKNLSITFLSVLFILLLSSFAIDENQEQIVFTCDHPAVKCYYVRACNALDEKCTNYKGSIYKMPLSRAKAKGKVECDCGTQKPKE